MQGVIPMFLILNSCYIAAANITIMRGVQYTVKTNHFCFKIGYRVTIEKLIISYLAIVVMVNGGIDVKKHTI